MRAMAGALPLYVAEHHHGPDRRSGWAQGVNCSSRYHRHMVGEARTLVRNTLAGYASTVVALVVSLAVAPFVVHTLGAEGFGVWALVEAVLAYGALFDLGIDHAVTKYVGETPDVIEHVDRIQEVVQTALAVYMFIAAAAIAFTALAVLIFPMIFTLRPELVAQSRLVIAIAGTSLAINLPLGMYNGVLLGLQRHHIAGITNIAWSLGTALGTVVVLSLGGGLVGLALVYLVGNTAGQLARIAYLRRTFPAVRWLTPSMRRAMARGLFHFSLNAFLLRLSGVVSRKAGELVVGRIVAVSSVTPLNIAQRISDIFVRLNGQLESAVYPHSSHLDAEGGKEAVGPLLISASRLNLALSLPMALFLFTDADRLVSAWMGPEYLSAAWPTRLLVAAGMIQVAGSLTTILLLGMNRHRAVARFSVLTALLFVVAAIFLVRAYGLIGAAVANLVQMVAFYCFFTVPYALREMKVQPIVLVRRALIPQLPALTAAAAVCLTLRLVLQWQGLPLLLVNALAVGLAYWGTYLALGADRKERELARRLVTQFFTRRPASGSGSGVEQGTTSMRGDEG